MKTSAPPCAWNCFISPMKRAFPTKKIWVDGIVTPVNIQQPQAISLMEFQKMIPDMCPGAKSTCGLSNISNGRPTTCGRF
jgi:hypothetical protein